MAYRLGLLCGIAMWWACGGDDGDTPIVVKGQHLVVADTISGSATLGSSSNTAGLIILTNVSGACADLTQGKRPKNSMTLGFFLTDVNQTTFATSAPTAPGTYTISGSATKSAEVSFETYDGTCAKVGSASDDGATGTVNLTGINNGAYSGDFDVIFTGGDHIKGSFGGTACGSMNDTVNQGNSFTCI